MHESFISSLDPCHIQLCDHNFTSAAYEKSASSSTLLNTTDFLQLSLVSIRSLAVVTCLSGSLE